MNKRFIAAAGMAVAVALSATACSSGGGGDATSGGAPGPEALAEAKGVTEVTVWHGLGGANGEAFTALVDEFNAENKGEIHVTETFQGVYADLLAKYTASLRSKSGPTIVIAGDIATGYMTDVQQSVSADDMAAANPDDLNLDDLSAAARNYYTVDDVQQAVPLNVSTPIMWVNKDLLAKAGITDLSTLSTVDGVVKAATAVTDTTGEKGFTMPTNAYYVEQLTATAGQEYCTPGNGRSGDAAANITINDGAARESISSIIDLYPAGVAVDGAPDGSAAISAFTGGKVAVFLNGSGLLGVLNNTDVSFEYEALPFPKNAESDKVGPVIGGSAMWLNSGADPAEQVAGWKFETFLTSPESQQQFSQATGYIPINEGTADLEAQKEFLKSSAPSKVFLQQVSDTPLNVAAAGCVSGALTNVRAAVVSELQAAFAGTKTAEQALDDAVTASTDAFATYQEQLGE